MRHVQQRRKKVRQVKVESAQGGNEFLNLVGFRIVEFYAVVDLLAQFVPVDIHKGIRTGDLPDDVVGDAGTFPELGQVQLLDPATLADVMHQIKSIPFATKKSHC